MIPDATRAEPLDPRDRSDAPPADPDGPVLWLELGATRERVEWLVEQCERLTDDASGANAQAEYLARHVRELETKIMGWRVTAVSALAMAGLLGLLAYAGVTNP